jgi:hypothetical protein
MPTCERNEKPTGACSIVLAAVVREDSKPEMTQMVRRASDLEADFSDLRLFPDLVHGKPVRRQVPLRGVTRKAFFENQFQVRVNQSARIVIRVFCLHG